MSNFAALFRHRDPTPVRRVTLGALSLVLGRKSECAPTKAQSPPMKVDDTSSRLTGASLKLCADPTVPFLATLASVTIGGVTSSEQKQQRLAPLYDTQPLASCIGLISSGLGLSSSCPS